MLDFIKTYFVFVILHKWNKVSRKSFDILDEHWDNQPTKGIKLWVYNKVKQVNKI